MDMNNLEYLQKTLDYLGFGTRLHEVLESSVYRQLDKFSLGISQRYIAGEFRSDPGKQTDATHFELNFSKAKEGEVYFLNSYDVVLKRYNSPEPIAQRFELERDNRITALQSYKLLCGLSLEKEIFVKNKAGIEGAEREKVPVWFSLDLSVTNNSGNHPLNRFYPGYGYDLEKAIEKYPFVEAKDQEKKEALTRALRYGNLIELSLRVDEKEQQVYVAANPKLKTLDIYTKDMVRVRDNQIFSVEQIAEKNQAQATKRAFDGLLPSPQVGKQFPWQLDGEGKEPKIGR
jgi:hypothetical protein